jgi:large subunit ribosomal protein L18
MIEKTNKNEIRGRIHQRIRRKVRGTPARPRLAVFRSLSHIYAQIIDDTKGQTLVAASSAEKTLLNGAASEPAPAAPAAKAEAPKAAKSEKGDKKGAKKAAAPPAKARGGNVAGARLIGKTVAERAKEHGIKQVVFDRGGYIYHGRIKALAEAAREAGLEF